jgi:hypothetical protein
VSKVVVFTMVLWTAALAGCASNQVSCLHDHKIVTAKADSSAVHIRYVDVRHEGDALQISGTLERRGMSADSISTHIDISLSDEQGQLLKKVRTEKIYVPRHQVGKGPHWTQFEAVIPVAVQGDITVHAQPHSDAACGL